MYDVPAVAPPGYVHLSKLNWVAGDAVEISVSMKRISRGEICQRPLSWFSLDKPDAVARIKGSVQRVADAIDVDFFRRHLTEYLVERWLVERNVPFWTLRPDGTLASIDECVKLLPEQADGDLSVPFGNLILANDALSGLSRTRGERFPMLDWPTLSLRERSLSAQAAGHDELLPLLIRVEALPEPKKLLRFEHDWRIRSINDPSSPRAERREKGGPTVSKAEECAIALKTLFPNGTLGVRDKILLAQLPDYLRDVLGLKKPKISRTTLAEAKAMAFGATRRRKR